MTRWRVSTLVAVTVVATVASGCNKKKQAPPERSTSTSICSPGKSVAPPS